MKFSKKIDAKILSSQTLLTREIVFHKAKIRDEKVESFKSNFVFLTKQTNGEAGTHASNISRNGEESEEDELLREPNFYLYPRGRLQELLEWKDTRKVGSGLQNLGNTCFLNSALQCLLYAPALNNFFQSREHSRSCRILGFCSMCEMERLSLQCSQSKGPVAPKKIIGNLKSEFFRPCSPAFFFDVNACISEISKLLRFGRQEDSHEFLRCLLDAMQSNCAHGFPKLGQRELDTSVISQIFGGYLQSQVKCSNCGHESNKIDPFMDISLEIKGASSLQEAFQLFTAPEILDHDNKYKCSK